MMFIICDKVPYAAVKYLIEHSPKQFYFKQLIELGQLICSTGISSVYKRVYRGKEIQTWIVENPGYTVIYFDMLFEHCKHVCNLTEATVAKLSKISKDLHSRVAGFTYLDLPDYAIFRYKQDYESVYPTNSVLLIDVAVLEYRKYLNWKAQDLNWKL